MYADIIRRIQRLTFHPLNVFLAGESRLPDKQHEIFSLDALKKGAIVPRLGSAVLVVDGHDLRLIVGKISKRPWRLYSHKVDRTASIQKSKSTGEDNAQDKSHQGDKETKKPLFHVYLRTTTTRTLG